MPPDERPVLRPGSVLLHRTGRPGTTSIQIGLEPATAVRLDVPSRSCDAVLAGLDGTGTTTQVLTAAVARGADPAVATALLDRLRAAGVLVDARTWLSWTNHWSPAERLRRLPDLQTWDRLTARVGHAATARVATAATAGAAGAAAGLTRGLADGLDGAAEVMAGRAVATVRVVGAGRTGAGLALLLDAAGVGRIDVSDSTPVTPADISAYGYRPDQLGQPRARALRTLLRHSTRTPRRRGATSARSSGGATAGRSVGDAAREVVVWCGEVCEPEREEVAEWMRAGTAHLVVRGGETSGTVGPFVLPGETACVRCTDLHRADRDPDWPRLLSQLAVAPPPVPETVLAAQLAALAAAQLLHWLADGRPATAGRSIEVSVPGGTSRVTDWSPHPYCGCRWPAQFAEDTG